jgi:aryl-alcohol dehydrogenase-like predicted oxidoreductase
LHGGLLGGVLKKGEEGVRRLDGRSKASLDDHRSAIEGYEDLALQLGVQPAELGLAWLLHQPAVTAPIIGPRIAEQLDGALKAAEVRLDQDTLDRLDELFPGHKTAPEDYAW